MRFRTRRSSRKHHVALISAAALVFSLLRLHFSRVSVQSTESARQADGATRSLIEQANRTIPSTEPDVRRGAFAPLKILAQKMPGQRCPPITKQLLQGQSKLNTVMLGLLSSAQWDFGINWVRSLMNIGFHHFVLGAADADTSVLLATMEVPCFEFIDDQIQGEGAAQSFAWGQEGWRRMTWQKVLLVEHVVDWGLNLVLSDMDVAWIQDPLPYFLNVAHGADMLFSLDSCHTGNRLGDGGIDTDGNVHVNFNTGVYFLRNNERSKAWVHAWRGVFESGFQGNDQAGAYNLSRVGQVLPLPQDSRVTSAWNGNISLGFLPPSIFASGHTYTVQRLHEVHGLQPFEMHATWTYGEMGGKKARLRDAMLWIDDDGYYSQPSFVTVDLHLPHAPEGFNNITENEEMIGFHLATIHSQLYQAYAGMALAISAHRAFISPKFQCYCEKIWYGVVRCRVVDAQDFPFPIDCPTDYLFQPDHFLDSPETHGTPLDFREPSFLDNPRTPQAVKDSVLVIHPTPALLCTDCVVEERGRGGDGRLEVQVPLGLKDSQLLPLLQKYRRYRVWMLSFKQVASLGEAYGGFACAGAAAEFDKRMDRITTFWCCRQEQEAKELGLQDRITEQLHMSPRKYSDQPGLDSSC